MSAPRRWAARTRRSIDRRERKRDVCPDPESMEDTLANQPDPHAQVILPVPDRASVGLTTFDLRRCEDIRPFAGVTDVTESRTVRAYPIQEGERHERAGPGDDRRPRAAARTQRRRSGGRAPHRPLI